MSVWKEIYDFGITENRQWFPSSKCSNESNVLPELHHTLENYDKDLECSYDVTSVDYNIYQLLLNDV